MQIAIKRHTAGNIIRYEVDYSAWLEDGRTLKGTGFSATFVAPAPADATLSAVSVTEDTLYFVLGGGSVNETFTVQVQVTDTLNEVVIDTIQFFVQAP